MLRHQLGDKRLLTGTAQVIRPAKFHGEEAFAQTLPERRVARLINHAAHLRDHFFVEAVAKGGHKHKARFGEQITVALFAPVRIEKQGAEFAGAGMVITEEERRQRVVNVQFFRGVDV